MDVPPEDQIVLDKLWKFAKSEHFAEIYEEIVRRENFVDQIVKSPAPIEGLSPFRQFTMSNLSRKTDIFSESTSRMNIAAELKNLVELLENQAEPYSAMSHNDFHQRLLAIKNSIQWL